MKRFSFISVAVGAVVAIVGVSMAIWLGRLESRRYQQDIQAAVLQQLSTARTAVESALNERIALTLGLRAYVSTNPNLTPEQFARFAAALMEEGDGIRSVTLIPDNVISDVFPREGNESAIGIRLLDLPDQRDDVRRAIATREPWLSPPIQLVQGGEAFVNRAPVYVTPEGDRPGSGHYWGLVSILISKDELLNDVVRGLPDGLALGIRGKAASGGEYFLGDASIESAQPIWLDVSLPTGDWEMAGAPTRGWPTRAPAAPVLQWLGAFVSVGLGVLTSMLLRSNQNYLASRTIAEDAVVELSRKNEDLETFVRAASHDLRAPLRHIKTFSGFLAEDAKSRLIDDDLSHLNRIDESIERMMQLLTSLLQFAKLGTKALTRQGFSMREAAEFVVCELPESERPRVHLHELPQVYGDRTLLTQVLQNLIQNGLKYHDGDDPQVHVRSSSTETEATISISDNGIGIEANQLVQIFTAGIRGVSPSDYTGSGFGLAICERIVKAHGGRIWAESVVGQGSTFHFTLPTRPAVRG